MTNASRGASVVLTPGTARRLALRAQLLDGRIEVPKGKEGVARTIEALGYVQIDTIAVVERAHHHTLWTRRPDYEPGMLHRLQAVDRRVFEYWGHGASYLPMSEYRFYRPLMRRLGDPGRSWIGSLHRKYNHLTGPVLERIRKEGPLTSKDFKPPPGRKRGTWWDWKPAKTALELLFWRGELMVTERRNFQRVYDLTERVLPRGIDTRLPDDDELGRFLVRRALRAHGIAREKTIREHIPAADRSVIVRAIHELEEEGEVLGIQIKGPDGIGFYALSETMERASRPRRSASGLHLLSPFDNLVILRDRTKRLFGFEYALECYLPVARRAYGYFTLPILFGDRFVGRLDPKADRRTGTLILRNVHFEPDVLDFDELLPAFAGALVAYARFNRCERINVERTTPVAVRAELNRSLKSLRSDLK
jgi:hypothetical protein